MRDDVKLPKSFSMAGAKPSEYLLNLDHKDGGPKARFFMSFGFSPSDPRTLAFAILSHARPERFVRFGLTPLGDVKLIYEGPVETPDGRNPNIRTVWRVVSDDTGEFVTAVPITR